MALDNLKSVFTYRFGHDDELSQASAAQQWACGLTAQAGAHLGAVIATQRHAVSNVMGASLVSGVVGSENRNMDAAAAAAAGELQTAASSAGVQCNVRTLSATYPEVREHLTSCARLYDLVVADAAPDASSMQRELLVDILFHAARPVVVVPLAANAVSLNTVVVGWDGSGPATRALHDAMPLLRGAQRVEVVNVLGDKELPAGGTAAAVVPHLQRHGIAAEAREIQGEDADAAQVLLQHATAAGAGLVVVGAYAHSRLRQLVFGGVTSVLMKGAPMPVLLSH